MILLKSPAEIAKMEVANRIVAEILAEVTEHIRPGVETRELDEVAEAVAKCHRAGIRIVMVTGDYGLTAESMARRIGIFRGPAPRILNGVEMDGMSDGELSSALRGEVIGFERNETIVAPLGDSYDVGIGDRVQAQVVGNTIVLTGQLPPLEYRQLARSVRGAQVNGVTTFITNIGVP